MISQNVPCCIKTLEFVGVGVLIAAAITMLENSKGTWKFLESGTDIAYWLRKCNLVQIIYISFQCKNDVCWTHFGSTRAGKIIIYLLMGQSYMERAFWPQRLKRFVIAFPYAKPTEKNRHLNFQIVSYPSQIVRIDLHF